MSLFTGLKSLTGLAGGASNIGKIAGAVTAVGGIFLLFQSYTKNIKESAYENGVKITEAKFATEMADLRAKQIARQEELLQAQAEAFTVDFKAQLDGYKREMERRQNQLIADKNAEIERLKEIGVFDEKVKTVIIESECDTISSDVMGLLNEAARIRNPRGNIKPINNTGKAGNQTGN